MARFRAGGRSTQTASRWSRRRSRATSHGSARQSWVPIPHQFRGGFHEYELMTSVNWGIVLQRAFCVTEGNLRSDVPAARRLRSRLGRIVVLILRGGGRILMPNALKENAPGPY